MQNKNRLYFQIINILIILLLISTGCSDNKNIVAEIGTHKITLKQWQKRYSEFLSSTGIKDNLPMRHDILDNMVNEIILYYYDDNNKIFNNPEYQKEIEWLKKEAILAFVKDRDIYAKITATDEELREAYYKAHVAISARHLFARTKEEADNLYQLLKAGADFNTLAKQVFTDSTLKANGGYIGWFTWGDMDPAFEDAAYKLRPGEISSPVQTAQGYSIIKVEDRKVQPLMTEYDFNRRKKDIERSLRISKKRPAEKEFIKKLMDPEKLKFNNEAIDFLFEHLNELNSEVVLNRSDDWVAQYENRKYRVGEVAELLNSVPLFHRERMRNQRLLRKGIEGLLVQQKIYEYAIDKGYDKNSEVLEAQYKLTMNKFLQTKMDEISMNASIPDSAAMKYYEENINVFSEPQKINVSEIIVSRKTLADSIMNFLNHGSDFGTLAEKYSIRKWSAKNRGEIGLASLERFGLLKEKLWNAPIGKIVGPYKINEVFGIFKVTEKVDARPIPFEKIKDEVVQKAKLDMRTKLVSNYLEKKRKEIDLNIYYDNLIYSAKKFN
ncbi:MAG: hypothetical protein D6830_07470 [Ignavibacteria bacterium]|nr:MAG: hypothetical protein D6830_07470 [Ignavibacteria bacterium]